MSHPACPWTQGTMSAEMPASDMKTHPPTRSPWVALARGHPIGDSCPPLEKFSRMPSFCAAAISLYLGMTVGMGSSSQLWQTAACFTMTLGLVAWGFPCSGVVLAFPQVPTEPPRSVLACVLLLQLKASRWRQDIKYFVNSSLNWRGFMFILTFPLLNKFIFIFQSHGCIWVHLSLGILFCFSCHTIHFMLRVTANLLLLLQVWKNYSRCSLILQSSNAPGQGMPSISSSGDFWSICFHF